MSVADAVKAQMFRRVLSLPPQWVRRLAGRPIRMDGMTLSPQSQLLLRLQRLSFERGAETLPIPEGRIAMRRHAVIAGGTQPIGQTRDVTVQGADGLLGARLYVPRSKVEGPLLVFFHGGGMIYGDLDSHDALCRFLAERADVRVLAVDYRLAPEHPFPAGVDDAYAAYESVLKNATDYGADPERLAVGGDSAGGYLAAATAIRAAEENLPLRYQLLIYPVTKMSGGTRSRELFARDLYLTHDFMELATSSYLRGEDLHHPRASVLHADIPTASRRRTSPPPASTRCATRARPTQTSWRRQVCRSAPRGTARRSMASRTSWPSTAPLAGPCSRWRTPSAPRSAD